VDCAARSLGSGSTFMKATPSGFMRVAGMMLPGNGPPVFGSLTGIRVPLLVREFEKSPARS
jgi:hypothetical protein